KAKTQTQRPGGPLMVRRSWPISFLNFGLGQTSGVARRFDHRCVRVTLFVIRLSGCNIHSSCILLDLPSPNHSVTQSLPPARLLTVRSSGGPVDGPVNPGYKQMSQVPARVESMRPVPDPSQPQHGATMHRPTNVTAPQAADRADGNKAAWLDTGPLAVVG